jgi:hypothetical protein
METVPVDFTHVPAWLYIIKLSLAVPVRSGSHFKFTEGSPFPIDLMRITNIFPPTLNTKYPCQRKGHPFRQAVFVKAFQIHVLN